MVSVRMSVVSLCPFVSKMEFDTVGEVKFRQVI